MYNVLDLFCGCGGLSQGFALAGFNIIAGVDFNQEAIDTFNFNYNQAKGICCDLMEMDENKIISTFGDLKNIDSIKLMKDPTRGGLATALNEIAEFSGIGIHIIEKCIPIKSEVNSLNQLLGLDPLYMACEGRMILVVDSKKGEEILQEICKCNGCENSAVIGSAINNNFQPIVFMETHIGGRRILGPLEGEMLPRIC